VVPPPRPQQPNVVVMNNNNNNNSLALPEGGAHANTANAAGGMAMMMMQQQSFTWRPPVPVPGDCSAASSVAAHAIFATAVALLALPAALRCPSGSPASRAGCAACALALLVAGATSAAIRLHCVWESDDPAIHATGALTGHGALGWACIATACAAVLTRELRMRLLLRLPPPAIDSSSAVARRASGCAAAVARGGRVLVLLFMRAWSALVGVQPSRRVFSHTHLLPPPIIPALRPSSTIDELRQRHTACLPGLQDGSCY